MADPLLAKLDRLMRQMERGQLLEDEQGDAPGGELDNGRRAPRRQRQQRQAKPFKNWDSGSTSYKLPEYDALRDPHCRYTKQRQFKQQWDKFSKAAMIQEVLRGDHAALLDVLHATKKKGAKKAAHRGPRTGLTDRSGYGLDGRARRKKKKMARRRSPNGNGMRLPNVGRPAAQRRGAGRRGRGARGGRVPGAAYYGTAAPSASPSAPMRDDFSMDAPSLPPMFSNGAEMRGRRKRRNKGGNESWKRTGATSSVNAAVLRYRNKRDGKAMGSSVDGSSPGATSATHGDRVEREYLRARQSSKRYRKKAQLDALRKKALLPPMPDATNFSPRGAARERRRREKEHAGALNGGRSEGNSISTLPPEPKAAELPSPERAREDQISDLDGTPATSPAKRSVVNDAAPEFSPTAPNSPDSPGGGYSDEDFEDDDFEDDDDEEVDDENVQSQCQGQGRGIQEKKSEAEVNLEAKSVAVSQTVAGANALSPQQEQRQAQETQRQQAKEEKAESLPKRAQAYPATVTMLELEANVPGQFKRCTEQLFKLAFSVTRTVDADGGKNNAMSVLSELNTSFFSAGTNTSAIASVAEAVVQTLSQAVAGVSSLEDKVLTVVQCLQAVSNAASAALYEAATLIDSAIDSAESDIGSQKAALRRATESGAAESGFTAARLPLAIARGIAQAHRALFGSAAMSRCDGAETETMVCASLDRIVRATALGLLRSDADASGRERLGEFVSMLGGKLKLAPTVRSSVGVDLSDYGIMLSAATKGVLMVLLWQSSHGGAGGEGTQRLRFVTTRDAALRDSFAWALTNESGHSWVPELCRSSDPNPWRTRLSAQLLFPYFKRRGKKEGTLGEDNGGKIEGGLEEGEGSGPRKEFFGLAGAQLQQSSAFTYIKAVESFWLAHFDEGNAPMLRWIGYLMGCALTSRCHLGVRLPEIVFEALLTARKSPVRDATWADVAEISPELHKGLTDLSSMSQSTFAEYMEMEGLEASMTKEEYIARDIQERLLDPVRKALDELRTGFQSAINLTWCKAVGMTALDLRLLVCGNVESENANRDFDVRDVFRLRMDDDVSDNLALQNALFGAINAMSPADKRMFLKFVTGVDKLPLPKTECLKIEAPGLCFSEEEYRKQWSRLPTAHTCFNTLEIPNYAECLLELEYEGRAVDELDDVHSFKARLLEHVTRKLAIAVANTDGGGYGLDEAVRNREALFLETGADGGEAGFEAEGHTENEDVRLGMIRTKSIPLDEGSVAPEKPALNTGRSSVQSFGGNDSGSSLDIPGLSDSDDDVFNDF